MAALFLTIYTSCAILFKPLRIEELKPIARYSEPYSDSEEIFRNVVRFEAPGNVMYDIFDCAVDGFLPNRDNDGLIDGAVEIDGVENEVNKGYK